MNKALSQPPQKRSLVGPVLVVAVLVIFAALGYKGYQSGSPAKSTIPTAETQSLAASTTSGEPLVNGRRLAASPAQTTTVSTPPLPLPSGSVPETTPADPRDLVSALVALDGKKPITPEQAQKWKDSLQQLVRQGLAAVPAIQEFLMRNQDANYAGVNGAEGLGYNSLRSAMLDALTQIGGPDTTQAMLQIMQNSVFPTDIATLAKTLDTQGGGAYQQNILDAVRAQLNWGSSGQLNGANVLPLFQVLADEAAQGANVSGDLSQFAAQWPYYSAIALASLPDGAGVPSLIQLAQGNVPGNQAAAAQALAELAPQNPQVLSSLLGMAKVGQLSDTTLAQLAPYLAGRAFQLGPPQDPSADGILTMHIAIGNQDFSAFDSSGTLTPAQITQRLDLIDQFMQAIPSSDVGAQEALQQQRNTLVAKQNP